MTAWACAAAPSRILEPAAGEGVFLDAVDALVRRYTDWTPVVEAHEVDDRFHARIRVPSRVFRLKLSKSDFVLSRDARRYDACVANPPYVRHHTLSYDEAVYRRFDALVGERISRMTNLYGLFMLRIWERLAAGGRAAIIVPAEWLNADFGRPLKRYFLRENAIDGIVLFDDDALVFDNALTTAAILLLRRGRGPRDTIRSAVVRDTTVLANLRVNDMRAVDPTQLDADRKWTNTLADESPASHPSNEAATLSDVATCMRGIATGANNYFTLTEPERRDAGIDCRDLTPCITKAGHAPTDVYDQACFERAMAIGRKIWLLTPREPLRRPVERYLTRGRELGIDDRYLPSHRPVWYRPENRRPAPIWSPVFVRGRFRFIRNAAGALNLTAFHAVYPVRDDDKAINALLEYLWSDAAQRAIGAQSRLYGGGLRKLEPRDVLAIPIPMSLKALLGELH